MYRIVTKEALKPTVILYEIEAPMVAKKAQPGQFIILRVDENGERIPITIHDYDREKGTVTIIVQTVGATTEKLSHKQQGDCLHDFVGPLGKPTETEGKKKVCVVGGGVGCAIAYPVLKKFHDCGAEVHAVVGFKNKDVVILEDKFKAVSSVLKVCTDDGSYGQKGLVTEALKELLDEGNIVVAVLVNFRGVELAEAVGADALKAQIVTDHLQLFLDGSGGNGEDKSIRGNVVVEAVAAYKLIQRNGDGECSGFSGFLFDDGETIAFTVLDNVRKMQIHDVGDA